MTNAWLDSSFWGLPAAILSSAALAHLAFRFWLHRRRKTLWPAQHDTLPTRFNVWLSRSIDSYARPTLLLLWSYGMYQAGLLVIRHPAFMWAAKSEPAVKVAYGLSLTAGLFWLFLRIGARVDELLRRLAQHTTPAWDDVMLSLIGQAARRLMPFLALPLGLSALQLPPSFADRLQTITAIAVILFVGWVLSQAVEVTAAFALRRYPLDVKDNLEARAAHTQVGFLQKTAHTVIAVLTLGSILMVFPRVRQFGTSILASAGIAGIVVGLAAQRSLSTLLAGFQLAMTQPIRVDDVVVVEGEWGRVEDITLTYVVLRLWDDRRLVVPIGQFIEKPFQNWTRTGSALSGTVFLYVDYSVPMDALRGELARILETSKYWDRRVSTIQVTDARVGAVELRVMVSASDAGALFDLRCEVRERLIVFVQRHYPTAWPVTRAALATAGTRADDDEPVALPPERRETPRV